MPVCYNCGKRENAMKCMCEECAKAPANEIDKLIRQIALEEECVSREEDKRYLDGQVQILLILRGKL